MKCAYALSLLLLAAAVPAVADVLVTSPANGATVSTSFGLVASATPQCLGQNTVSMGYSLDSSWDTQVATGTSLNVQLTASLGTHTLHVKSWNQTGGHCVTDVLLNVINTTAPAIPLGATAVSKIQGLPNWHAVMDPATGTGTSIGSTGVAASPSLSGMGRQFVSNYTNAAGQRYYVTFGADRSATDFVYDSWVYVGSPSANVRNLDFEVNQVIPNGQTVIYALRCDGGDGFWDYTENVGTPQAYSDAWVATTASCNPASWSANAWHHVQIAFHRDDYGNVTYESVWLDGARQDLNATALSAFALGWANSTLLTNFQVDGAGASGTTTVYMDNLTIYRWAGTVDNPLSVVPATAVAVSGIQGLPNWKAQHDLGTGTGVSTGLMNLVVQPSVTGTARQFVTDFTNFAGERYAVTFDSDPTAHNFLYDGWVFLATPTNLIANLELDMNQVMTNGQTVIYGIQCDGGSGTWDYTQNAGTPAISADQWLHSTAACNPREWTPDTWHHVQLLYSRDDSGNVTYRSIWLDSVEQDLNVTVPSSFALGWGSVLLTNFQVDGVGNSGAATAYLDNLTIYRW